MKRIKQFIILPFIIGSCLSAQDKKFDVTLKSPDAAQISKFTDMPSSTYTGIVSSNIPLYEIKIDNETFPITINYHGSGVKVKEVASKVGLGWSLSVGNTSLSKQIFGAEDKGWVPNIPVDENNFTPNDRQTNSYALATGITGFNQNNGSQDLDGLKRDTQPDIFSYSVNGVSGEFHYDHAGKIIQIPYQKVKIENVFKITDDKGVVYNFVGGNTVKDVGGSIPTASDLHVTDYIIQSIVYPSGKTILFEYEASAPYGYLSNYTKRYSYPISGCQTSVGSGDAQNEFDEYATYTNIVIEKFLKKITFPEGEIIFNYSTREDIIEGKRFSNITIRDKNQKIIKNYQFNQNYFTSTEQIDVLNYTSQISTLMKRLKLNELVETVEGKKYQFEYNEDYSLPNRFSNATDYMGYYNGQNTNSGIEYVEYNDQIYGLGDNKEPNINFAKLGALKKIIYPTGGYIEFEYENDSFHFNDYEKKISKQELFLQDAEPMQTISTPTSLSKINFKVKFESTVNPVDDGSGSLPIGPHFVGEILDASDNLIETFVVVKDYDFLLPAQATYKVRIRKSGTIPTSEYASLKLEWFEVQKPFKDYDKNIGGIRIKKIVKKDSDNTISLVQSYKYTLENSRTSGEYFGDKINFYYFSTSPFGDFGASCERMIITNSGNANIATINGKVVAYNRVITETENLANSESYKTIDYFTNYPSSNYAIEGQPFFMYANNQYARGILNKKEIFNSTNKLLEKQEFNYEFDHTLNQQSSDYFNILDTTIQPYVLNIIAIAFDAPTTFPYYYAIFQYFRYSVTSSWVKLKTQNSTRYFDNNQNIVETSHYEYDDTYKHLNPISLAVDFSDNASQVTSYSYANEKSNQYLIDKNMVGIPLETIVKKKQDGGSFKVISQQETIYPTSQAQADTKTSGLPLPFEVWSKDLQNISKKELTYDKYDAFGNIQQYTTKAGIPTAIIWGYNNTQPIAKIEGATYAAVQGLISGIVTASNTDANGTPGNDETTFLGLLDAFRKTASLSAYQITTYTYDPLIGVRSITPPSGIREKYIYDSANRLEKIVQEDGKILKEFKYNYKP